MPRNDDGEMELVLGNRQLLSVLFILVVLLGVFFTMGYIVGRNNPSEEKVRIATARQNASNAGKLPPVTVDPANGAVSQKPAPSVSAPVTVDPKEEPKAKQEAKKETPKKEEPKPEPVKPEAAKKEQPKKEEAKKKEPAPAPVESSGLFQATPAPGQYLQVAAIDRPGATGMAEAYRKQGFAAVVTPSSSPTLFRVVIGPLKNSDAVADTKLKLKKIGVDGAILRKF